MKTGIELIADERKRQIEAEGWTPEHDDVHGNALALAAGCYVDHVVGRSWLLTEGEEDALVRYQDEETPDNWPADWDESWWKPKGPLRDLVRAGALIAAEIDRRLRAGQSV